MTANWASALRTFSQLRTMPAVRSLAGAQSHLGGFAFWNSHRSEQGKQEIRKRQGMLRCSVVEGLSRSAWQDVFSQQRNFSTSQLQFVQFTPVVFEFRGALLLKRFGQFDFSGVADASAFAVASRMSRQVQQNVFTHEW